MSYQEKVYVVVNDERAESIPILDILTVILILEEAEENVLSADELPTIVIRSDK